MPDLQQKPVKPTKFILPISFGKDSVATAILCHEHGIPIDEAIYTEVMFQFEPFPVSGENPAHLRFIREKAIPVLESWGIKVTVLRSDKCYLDCFYHKIKHARLYPEHEGMSYGFPKPGMCQVMRDCKYLPAMRYLSETSKQYNVVEYLGYTVDEPKRLKHLEGTNNVSILAEYGLTQKDTYALAKRYGLLSPIYSLSGRGGCWMCGYAKDDEILDIMHGPQSEAWERFVSLEDVPNIVYGRWSPITKETLHERDQRLKGL